MFDLYRDAINKNKKTNNIDKLIKDFKKIIKSHVVFRVL